MAQKKKSSAPAWALNPQYQAFEADLTAHPDDDTPRLVLADWLEENGDDRATARAEFIRVQIELSRLKPRDPRKADLEQRERELLGQYERYWLGPLDGIVTEAIWRRGFPQRLKLGVRAFMDNADELFRQAPILHLQLLRISQTKIPMDELAACSHFARLRGLSFPGSSIGDEKLSIFLNKVDLKNLETLDLSNSGASENTLAAITQAEVPQLRELHLAGNVLEFVVQRLLQDNVSFRLRSLNLGNTVMNSTDLAVLFGWVGLQEVERLNVRFSRLGNEGARLLASSPYLGRLKSLDLYGCEIGTRGMQIIANGKALATLEEIELACNGLRNTGLEALLGSAFIENLESLQLSTNALTDRGVETLAKWPGLSKIKALNLSWNYVTTAGIDKLCSSPHLGRLTHLFLAGNYEIGDEGIRILANCSKMVNLQHLDLTSIGLSDVGAEVILSSSHLQNLKLLHASIFNVSKEKVKELLRRFPGSTVY